MIITEVDAVMKYKDESGNTTEVYPITKKDNVDGLDGLIRNQSVVTFGDGAAYSATVWGIDSLVAGVSFVMVPHVTSTSTSPTLNVNDLGEVRVRRSVTYSSNLTSAGCVNGWLASGVPVRVTYNGTFWIVDSMTKPSATDLMGTVPIKNGGTGANSGSTGLQNLFAAGDTILSSYQYGDTLPTPGTPGRIFFKRGNVS